MSDHIRYADTDRYPMMLPVSHMSFSFIASGPPHVEAICICLVQRWSMLNWLTSTLQHSCNLRSQTQTLPASWHWGHALWRHAAKSVTWATWICIAHGTQCPSTHYTSMHKLLLQQLKFTFFCSVPDFRTWQLPDFHTKFASFWASWLGSLLSDFHLLGSRFHLNKTCGSRLFKKQLLIADPYSPPHMRKHKPKLFKIVQETTTYRRTCLKATYSLSLDSHDLIEIVATAWRRITKCYTYTEHVNICTHHALLIIHSSFHPKKKSEIHFLSHLFP